MRDPTPQPVRPEDYTPPPFLVREVALDFEIGDEFTTVRARLAIERNPAARDAAAPLALDGDELELVSVAIDGRILPASAYALDASHLTIPNVPDACVLETSGTAESRDLLFCGRSAAWADYPAIRGSVGKM